ncbi:hypothetical protein AB0C87_19995 [Actinomadura sp. NPDC048021]|uniref:hypothetical protein n=1 Tax=Actinomadura sp. NPDC048021 TaxID=3155385 RepID=UPI0033FF743A
MEAELSALASVGATTLVGLMVSDSWSQVKGSLARLFGRHGPPEVPLQELEYSRMEILAAYLAHDASRIEEVGDHWRGRLESLLLADATAEEEVRRLLTTRTARSTESVSNFNSGDVTFGSVIQAGQISGDVNVAPPISETGPARDRQS